jgi:hypothetical protein
MKIPAAIATLLSAIFAVICFSVAIEGYTSLGDISDPVQLDDAKGFAGFWAFLGGVALVFGVLSWWIVRTGKEDE